jgi:endonuclease YncB( thermonuclease family)
MKKIIIIILISIFCLLGFKIEKVSAMPVGTLLYRTSSNGEMYGLNKKEIISREKGIINHMYSGHAAIYVGKIEGQDYIVEALAGGLQKTEAKYFIDEGQGEKFLGAKIPKNASDLQRQMSAEIALALSEYDFAYDLDFHNQKGPGDNEWTCVGLTEKVYESADINNPYDFSELKYDNNYAVDITRDGYDDYSIYNSRGDVFSRSREFSLIKPYTNTIIPAPELLGFSAGRQYKGDRYFFLPYTQFLQDTLEEVEVDIDIGSENTTGIRTGYKAFPLALKWSFINQPLSMIKKVSDYIKEQKAIAYSANNNNNYEIGDSDNKVNKSATENNSPELSTLLKEEIALNNNLDTKNVVNYADIIKELSSNKEEDDILFNDDLENKLAENINYKVKEIISADTIILDNDIQVTFASIAVPQLKDKIWKLDECQAEEAYNMVKELLNNNTVKLIYGNRASFDSSSRLLAYVYFKDKETNDYQLLNNRLLQLGLANILDCNAKVYCDLSIYKELEKSYQYAQDNKLGIFSTKCINNNENKISNLGKNLFRGISLKTNQIINNLGQVINKPKKEDQIVNDFKLIPDNDNDFTDSNDNIASDTANTNIFANDNLEENDNDDSSDNDYNTCLDKLLISAVYSTKEDDWIEIYNNCAKDVDLAESNIRLEKAVSANNPSIMVRFNQASDFSAINTIIKAYDTYLISRAEASLNFNVEAVSLRDNFSLGDSGYSTYLAKGPVSASDDEDIIDLLGYGEANYFRGTRPAPAIDDYYVLRRKADINSNTFNLYPQYNYDLDIYNSGHNFQDFILLDTGLAPLEEEEDNESDDSDEDDNENNEEDENNDEDDEDNSEDDEDNSEDDEDNSEDDEDNSEDDEDNSEDDESDLYNTCVDELLISAVYTTGQDDYIEIYNNCNESIDLFNEHIRLEKAVSLEVPNILVRFDEVSDYTATSTVIAPNSTYTISRKESKIDFDFNAKSLRNDFTLSGDAYSIYLAKGPVSTSDDEDIIDLLGYGEANYYSGFGPASFIDDYSLLRRKANIESNANTLDVFHDYSASGIYNSLNNFADFITISTGFDDNTNDTNEGDENNNNNDVNNPYLSSLWHFDSCFGDYIYNELNNETIDHNWQWTVGDGSCALRAEYSDEALEFPVSSNIDSNNMSILWNYQFEADNSRLKLELVTVEGDNLILTLYPYYFELDLPGHYKVRYNDYSLPLDTNWHSLAFTIDSANFALNLYLDKVIFASFTLGQRLFDVSSIKLISDNHYLKIDEVAIFNKALDEMDLSSLSSPIEPYQAPEFVNTLDLKHSWDFIEGQGNIAYDTINSYNLDIDESFWSPGISDFAIKMNGFTPDVVSDLFIDDTRKSFSLSFWYKNSAYPDEGRGRLMLKKGTNTKLGIKFTQYNSYLYYNHQELPLSEQGASFPQDDNWHFLTLTYNPNDYNLKFYLDGEEVYNAQKVWLEEGFDYMEIVQENWNFQLDEIKIYEGVLSSQAIFNTYQQKYY